MAKQSRTDSFLRITLYGILPFSFFTTFIIAGTMVLSYTFYLSEPVPKHFALGMAVALSTLIAFGAVVSLIIRLRQEKGSVPGPTGIRPRFSDPSIILEPARSPERHQEEEALNRSVIMPPLPTHLSSPSKPQSYTKGSIAFELVSTQAEPTELEQRHPTHEENAPDHQANHRMCPEISQNDDEKPVLPPPTHRLHSSSNAFPNQRREHAQNDLPQAESSWEKDLHPKPLVPRKKQERNSRVVSLPDSLRSALPAWGPRAQDSELFVPYAALDEASKREHQRRELSGVETRWGLTVHRDLALLLGTENGSGEWGSPKKREGGQESQLGNNCIGSLDVRTTDFTREPPVDIPSSDGEKDGGPRQRKSKSEKLVQQGQQKKEPKPIQYQAYRPSWMPVGQRIRNSTWGQGGKIDGHWNAC